MALISALSWVVDLLRLAIRYDLEGAISITSLCRIPAIPRSRPGSQSETEIAATNANTYKLLMHKKRPASLRVCFFNSLSSVKSIRLRVKHYKTIVGGRLDVSRCWAFVA